MFMRDPYGSTRIHVNRREIEYATKERRDQEMDRYEKKNQTNLTRTQKTEKGEKREERRKKAKEKDGMQGSPTSFEKPIS